uniref:Gag-Pol polyprotein n=1 Tax=Tanacetum cinerariifolium TaxID=118510 RepID=A0A699I0W2_TANCI|nr:hypothetical protein [Tanacetum cinerariifolium]GEZ07447.1 hypothetical protein [Tanacetum cinerariifolium]
MQTQTSNDLHNAIIEAGGKYRPPMLAPGNYVQWKSRIKRYIDTKPNHELVHYYLQNPPYKYKWADKAVLVTEGSSETPTERYMENYKNVSQDIRDQLNAEAEAVQIILTGIDKDIYSTVDAFPNACEMWKAIERLKQGESINFKDLETNLYWDLENSHHEMDNSPRINKGTGYDNQRIGNVVVARENAKDAAYYKEKMLLCKEEGARFQLNAEQADWRDDTDDEAEDQELEAHYMYMAKIQEVTPDEQNMIIDSLDMSYDREQIDQNDDVDLANKRDLLASLIEKLKCEIDDSKNHNKILETSNKTLVDKLKGEIEDFKTENKSLESSNNYFKEANNELSKTNQLMFKYLKKFQAELDRYNDVKYASKVEIDYAKAKGDLISYKMESKKSFNEYTRKINDLNQMISETKKELFAH